MSVSGVTVLAGVGVAVPLPPDIERALERVEIESAVGERGTFRLTFRLDPGSAAPAFFLRESGELVRVVLLAGDTETPPVAMDGLAVEHRVTAESDGRAASLVVSGEDLTLLMDLVDRSGRTFAGLTIDARVQLILASYAAVGIIPFVVPPPFPVVPPPAERMPHQEGTDDAYLRQLAADAGFQFSLDPGPAAGSAIAYWGPEPRGAGLPPSLVIDFRRPDAVDEFSLRFNALGRLASEASILDPATRVVITVSAPDLSVVTQALGAVVPPALRLGRLPGTAKLTASEAAGALLGAAVRTAEAVSGSGVLRVDRHRPRLRAGTIVDVRGAPVPFDGLFAVARVRDSIAGHAHHQEFGLRRAGLGAKRGPP